MNSAHHETKRNLEHAYARRSSNLFLAFSSSPRTGTTWRLTAPGNSNCQGRHPHVTSRRGWGAHCHLPHSVCPRPCISIFMQTPTSPRKSYFETEKKGQETNIGSNDQTNMKQIRHRHSCGFSTRRKFPVPLSAGEESGCAPRDISPLLSFRVPVEPVTQFLGGGGRNIDFEFELALYCTCYLEI
jgi:hypothetical protein